MNRRYRFAAWTLYLVLVLSFSACVKLVEGRSPSSKDLSGHVSGSPSPQAGNGGVYEAINIQDEWNLADPYCTDISGVRHLSPVSTLQFFASGKIYESGSVCSTANPVPVDLNAVDFSSWDIEMSAKSGALYVRRVLGDSAADQLNAGVAFCTYGTSTKGIHTGLKLGPKIGYHGYVRASDSNVVDLDPTYFQELYFVPIVEHLPNFLLEYATEDGNVRVKIWLLEPLPPFSSNLYQGEMLTLKDGIENTYPLTCTVPLFNN